MIENFLPDAQLAHCPKREPFRTGEIRRVIVISRLDPEKRVGLLLDALSKDALSKDALSKDPEAKRFEVRVYGTGWQSDTLQQQSQGG